MGDIQGILGVQTTAHICNIPSIWQSAKSWSQEILLSVRSEMQSTAEQIRRHTSAIQGLGSRGSV